jgi:signal transduction histidine kinase
MIIIIVIALFILAGNTLLQEIITNDYLRGILLILFSVGIYYFLAPSVIEPFIQTDAKLKEMIDHTLHELNTPIATIEANIALLKRTLTEEKAQKRLHRIEEAAKNLTKLYESIEYNIKENIEHIEKSNFLLHEILEESIAKFEEIKGDIQIYNDVENISLYTDQNGFERTMDNLISNAIKYNRPGGFVKLYTKENKLYIQDSGIGIDPKNLFIVYEKSFQENPTTVGFGLGLSIVKNFCDREKITIKIDTKKGEGTTISLDLQNICA